MTIRKVEPGRIDENLEIRNSYFEKKNFTSPTFTIQRNKIMNLLINEKRRRNTYFNLALEEALALQFVQSDLDFAVRFWENSNSIILGISDLIRKNIPPEILSPFEESFETSETIQTKREIIQIARRSSGGGTVYQDHSWNLNFSFFINLKKYPEFLPIPKSYEILSGFPIRAFQNQNIEVILAGKSDLSMKIGDSILKISGNSQFRKRDCLVHHGTLILSQKLIEKVSSLLLHPPSEPEYRKGRSHEAFITSLPEVFSISKFQTDLVGILSEKNQTKFSKGSLSFWKKILKETYRIEVEKYRNKDFIFSR